MVGCQAGSSESPHKFGFFSSTKEQNRKNVTNLKRLRPLTLVCRSRSAISITLVSAALKNQDDFHSQATLHALVSFWSRAQMDYCTQKPCQD